MNESSSPSSPETSAPAASEAPAGTPPTPTADPAEKKARDKNTGLWNGWLRPLLTVILIVTALRSSLLDWNDVPTGSMVPTVAVGDRIVVNKLAYAINPPFNGPAVAIPFTNTLVPWPLDFVPGFYYSQPQRNDIVTFWKPDTTIDGEPINDAGTRMVKRVVAVPGDLVEVRPATEKFDGRIFHFSKLIINHEEATYEKLPGIEMIETILGESRKIQFMRNGQVTDRFGQLRQFPLHPKAYEFAPYKLGEDEFLMIGDNRDNSQDGRFFGPVKLSEITGEAKFVAVSFDGSYFKPNWSRFFKGFGVDGIQEDH